MLSFYHVLISGKETGPQIPGTSNIIVEPMFSGPGNDSFRCVFDEVSGDNPVLYSVIWRVNGEYLTESAPSVNYTEFYLNDTIANSVTDGSMVCFKCYLCLVC
jgi:hypothetical protein